MSTAAVAACYAVAEDAADTPMLPMESGRDLCDVLA